LTKLHIKRGAFILLENEKIFHLAFEGYGQKPEFGEEDLYKFSQESRIIIFDELPENPFKELMQKFGISVIVPLRTKTEFDDILILGEKLSGGPYTNQDIRLLEIFAPEAAVAIANASAVARMTRLDELKSEFITVVSHQLRTPLSVARWNFELLLEQAFGRLPKKAHNIAQDIYQTLMVLNQGLNNLMSALEIEEGKLVMRFEDIEINKEVIEDTIAGFNREIRSKKIVLKSRLSFKGIVTADRQKLKKVFEVILDNAIRYSPSGSELTISTIRQSKKLRSELLISIEDEGIGILKKNREFLFQKFFRGDEAKKMSPGGFGLGLFIAKEYIEAHGGQLWAEGKEGGGSIFYFTIPVKE
jgi:signal transduction histidine kinase